MLKSKNRPGFLHFDTKKFIYYALTTDRNRRWNFMPKDEWEGYDDDDFNDDEEDEDTDDEEW